MRYALALVLYLLPFGVLAAPSDFKSLANDLIGIINVLIPLIFALTFLVLMWGIIKAWILNAGDENEVESGKKIALTGVIVLIIMSGIWGILYILRKSLFG